jgi:thiosulfate reductase cytochrome b subunit
VTGPGHLLVFNLTNAFTEHHRVNSNTSCAAAILKRSKCVTASLQIKLKPEEVQTVLELSKVVYAGALYSCYCSRTGLQMLSEVFVIETVAGAWQNVAFIWQRHPSLYLTQSQ